MGFLKDDRNPLIVPQLVPKRGRCPRCGGSDYTGRNVQGVVTFRCKRQGCPGTWFGGLPQEPQDPRLPVPPVAPEDEPLVSFVKDNKGQPVEMRKRVNLTPMHRRGK